MNVSVAEAKNRLPALLRAMEGGESIVITRNGKPVAQLVPPSLQQKKIQWGGMEDKIEFLPGWDDPIDLDRFLAGDL